jgi:hypothetical protein
MKGQRIKVERLFAAARTAPAEALDPMPDYLQSRILARASAEDSMPDLGLVLTRVLRWGASLAVSIMIACVAWNYHDLKLQPDNDVELVNIRAHLDFEL